MNDLTGTVIAPWIDGTLDEIAERLRRYAPPYAAVVGMIDGIASKNTERPPTWRVRRIRMVLAALDQVVAEPALDSGVAVYRTARRGWQCQCPGNGHENCQHGDCAEQIPAGARYVEYLGDAPAYKSGLRYCRPCGIATWRAESAS
ncbi:MAG TPA: hypothetical protein VFR67_14245 [Pilimelia sp.]|nr:hypothetical protein [Pilimelia sp.]